MMTQKKQNKIILYVWISSFVISLALVFHMRSEREKMLKTGTETVGIVTHTRTNRPNDPYCIDFSFIKDDTVLNGNISLTSGEKEQFIHAIVGNTYKVRYFDNKPFKARIYIDEPVSVSEEDYIKLLESVNERRQQVEKSKTWWKNF